jgi:hypothetical protein
MAQKYMKKIIIDLHNEIDKQMYMKIYYLFYDFHLAPHSRQLIKIVIGSSADLVCIW